VSDTTYAYKRRDGIAWDLEFRLNADYGMFSMVGDDRRHEFRMTDMVELDDGDYCGSCGQVGCRG